MSLARTAPQRVHARAPGKLNLFFEVGPLGPDGYHDVASAYQAVSLYEDVVATRDDGYSAVVTGDVALGDVPTDDRNLAVRAARLVAQEAGWRGGIRLDIRKTVPVAGGMGGGSADAAAALVAVDALLEAGLGAARLHELAARLGADVPFALRGGTAVGTGRGDELAPALAGGRLDWVVVVSAEGLSTPIVYGELDRLRAAVDIAPPSGEPAVDPAVLRALRAGDAEALAPALRNDLQRAALSLRPELAALLDEGLAAGALAALVSGSGPTLALLAAGDRAADGVERTLAARGHACRRAHGPVRGAHVVSIDA